MVSIEGGDLSLADYDVAKIDFKEEVLKDGKFDPKVVTTFFNAIKANKGPFANYKWIAVDSISELAEMAINYFQSINKDGRAAYGDLGNFLAPILRGLKEDKHHNVYITAKAHAETRGEGDNKRTVFTPMLPGSKVSQSIAYIYDVVAFAEAKTIRGEKKFKLYTEDEPGSRFEGCKDRTGKLKDAPYHLGKIESICRQAPKA